MSTMVPFLNCVFSPLSYLLQLSLSDSEIIHVYCIKHIKIIVVL